MISRLVGALLAVLAALFTLPSPAEAFVADVGAPTFVCDSAGLHGSVHRNLATERGPPASGSTDTIQEAVDRSSRGALARPAGATPSPTTCAPPATLARSARPTTTTGREVVVPERDLSPLQRLHVAANALPDALTVGGGELLLGARGAGVFAEEGETLGAANAGTRLRPGVTQSGVARTLENSLNPDTYVDDVVSHYGINLRGSGQSISVQFNPNLASAGRVRAATPNLIEVGPNAFSSSEEMARTLAHELNHARSFLRGGAAPESTAYGAEGYLSEWMAGLR